MSVLLSFRGRPGIGLMSFGDFDMLFEMYMPLIYVRQGWMN